MAARLILNADDFGLTRGVNRAVAELHAAGALTSATLMANGPAFDDAVRIALSRPGLGVGCHVVLTDGVPVSDPASIPTLIGPDSKTFRASLPDFMFAVLRGRVSPDDIIREATAQVQRLQRSGINVTHIDTHKHTHILPFVAGPLLSVAERVGIHAIRNPFEPSWSRRIGPSPASRRLQVALMARLRPRFLALPQIRSGAVSTPDGSIGIAATGSLNAATLAAIVAALPPKALYEVVLHPGYSDPDLDAVTTRLRSSRDIERLALLQTFPNPSAPELTHFGSLY